MTRRPDTNDNNTMKHHSQSSELTGSLAASESWQSKPTENPPRASDFMYNWIRQKSGK
jgi:hypothetical protein